MRRIILMFLANLFRLPYMLFMLFHLARRTDRYSKADRYAYLHRFVRWANRGGRVTVQVTGTENIPHDTGFIMYPNHQGLYDTLTMIESLPEPFSPVAKKETEHVFLLGTVLRVMGTEFMDRSDIRQSLEVIQSVAKRTREGESFVIFAEGTRSKKGNKMNPFKPGAFKAATLSHAPIIPVALVDCFIPFDRPSLKKITVQAHFLPAIPYEEYKGMKTPEIAELVQKRIYDKIAEVTA